MSNDSPVDQYFASTQMQSRWEDIEAEEINVKKTSHKIAELQNFASTSEESERSDSSSLKNLLTKSKQNTSKVKKAQSNAKKKKASRIKTLANLMNKKYTQPEGHEQVHDKKNYQSTLMGILGDRNDGTNSEKVKAGFSDNTLGATSDKLYSSEEWHQVQKSIELKYPNTDRKRHYVNVYDSFGPHGNPEKDKDMAIWSQANTPPQEKLSSQEFNILHRNLGAHEDMKRNKYKSREEEISANEPSSQYILTLSQIMDSHNDSVLEEVISDSSSCPSPLNYSLKSSGTRISTDHSQEKGMSDDEIPKYPRGHVLGTTLTMKNTPEYELPEAFAEHDSLDHGIPGSSPSTINDSEVYATPLTNLEDPVITSSIPNQQESDRGFDLIQDTSGSVSTQCLVSDSASTSNTASIDFNVLQDTSRIEKCEVQVRRGLNLRSCRIGSTKIYIKKLYTKNIVNNSDEEILASDFDPEDEGGMDVIEIIKQRADEDRPIFGSMDEQISASKPVLQVPSSPEIA
ncbi:Piso0_005700 [Millerozyma farinosa CBS 7064]|uniref:Piso0_005700 protein n=1 Tax=Pichia sorbitophila (strain ATCC MYA-4447 / BCRC 22081 / CBS 7064 / NBRC 10061 / NRRL Y-12695) TaxID=559304 RepID=G8Y2P2_PICSO|nr:Piso0_005700 [Millerozyma farinosa CBS 7064]